MALLDEIEIIVEKARAWESVETCLREVVTRPRLKILGLEPDDVTAEWVRTALVRLLEKYAVDESKR